MTTMRNWITLGLMVCVWFSLTAKTTQISLRITDLPSKEVFFVPTLNGQYFIGAGRSYDLTEGQVLTLQFETERPGLCYLTFADWDWPGTGGVLPVFVQPGNHIRLSFSGSDPVGSLRVSGAFSRENRYLATTRRPEITFSYMKKYWLDEPDAYVLGRQLEVSLKKEWVSLNTGALKTSPALPWLEADLFWYYINIMQGLFVQHQRVHGSNLIDWEPIYIQLLAQEPEQVYSRSSQWFPSAALNYAQGYQRQWYQLAKAIPEDQPVSFLQILESIPQTWWREVALARHLQQSYSEDPFPEIAQQYQYFQSRFGRSVCLPFLRQQIQPYIAFQRTYDPLDSTGLVLEMPENWQSFVRRYTGKIVLIQLWATWCESCPEEFAQDDALRQLQRKYPDDLAVVYVSMDAPEDRDRWHRDLHFYDLTYAQHLLPTGDLLTQIEDRMAERYAIPNNFILDREGQLLTNDAPLLSEGAQLVRILEALIRS